MQNIRSCYLKKDDQNTVWRRAGNDIFIILPQENNARLFKQNEMLSFRFRHCFERLFKTLQSSKYLEIFALPNNPGVKEFYIAFQFEDYLISLGMTHLKSISSASLTANDLFPYVLLELQTRGYELVLEQEYNRL